ncbi:TlpA family protein disulfide reductase [Burkholderia sp. 22PA0099]|uniref:TlpA family protein disulfide reductase n=1 Tax=Burkholderia sp. 22PA0099 TaxID=3237372 RepID=UPI0039C1B6C6
MTSVGPFSVQVVAIAAAALLAGLVAFGLQRRERVHGGKRAAALLLDGLLIALVAARLAYVARWWPQYAAAPRAIAAIGDGGFLGWAGVLAALAFLGWRLRGLPALRRPVLGGLAAGIVAWGLAQGLVVTLQRDAPQLASLHLSTLAGAPVTPALTAGKPVVANLWASWCPPCRREMPVLARAQGEHANVAILMINQGEDARTVRAFLDSQGLHFGNVLLDPASSAMRAYGSRGLPTTLFFDANGRLVESHVGEITAARLEDVIGARFGH